MTDTNIENAQKLSPDSEIVLFELTTTTGATVFFKSGPAVDYLGDTYTGVPCSMTAEKRGIDGSPQRPTLTVGGDDTDLAVLKPALFSGYVDGGTLQKHLVELEDLLNNVNNKITSIYRIKQLESYNRWRVSMVLSRFSPSSQTTIPYKKYTRPAFPYVEV